MDYRHGRRDIATVLVATPKVRKMWYATTLERSTTSGRGGTIYQTSIASNNSIRPTTADNYGATVQKRVANRIKKNKKKHQHIRQPSAPARTPAQAARPGSGSQSDAGEATDKESGRAHGNVQDLEQRGNAQ